MSRSANGAVVSQTKRVASRAAAGRVASPATVGRVASPATVGRVASPATVGKNSLSDSRQSPPVDRRRDGGLTRSPADLKRPRDPKPAPPKNGRHPVIVCPPPRDWQAIE